MSAVDSGPPRVQAEASGGDGGAVGDPVRAWTVEAVRRLGVTTSVETAGAILGIGRTKAYELARAGEFPVRLLRVGRRYLVPTPALLSLLGAE